MMKRKIKKMIAHAVKDAVEESNASLIARLETYADGRAEKAVARATSYAEAYTDGRVDPTIEIVVSMVKATIGKKQAAKMQPKIAQLLEQWREKVDAVDRYKDYDGEDDDDDDDDNDLPRQPRKSRVQQESEKAILDALGAGLQCTSGDLRAAVAARIRLKGGGRRAYDRLALQCIDALVNNGTIDVLHYKDGTDKYVLA